MSFLHHTCVRVSDPVKTINFYQTHFGLSLLTKKSLRKEGVDLYLLGLAGASSQHGQQPYYARGGILQLMHDPKLKDFKPNTGNQKPYQGYGHICFSVNEIEKTCEKLEQNGVKFQKKLRDGGMKTIAFVLDPDGYWVELISSGVAPGDAAGPDTKQVGTRFNHSMIRIKEKQRSLDFYRDKLGMHMLGSVDFNEAKFTLIFLSFTKFLNTKEPISNSEGILELTYNHGSDEDKDLHYHNGNKEPLGFSHIGISVTDVESTISKLEDQGVTVTKRPDEEGVGSVLDPDGYTVQFVPSGDYLGETSSRLA